MLVTLLLPFSTPTLTWLTPSSMLPIRSLIWTAVTSSDSAKFFITLAILASSVPIVSGSSDMLS